MGANHMELTDVSNQIVLLDNLSGCHKFESVLIRKMQKYNTTPDCFFLESLFCVRVHRKTKKIPRIMKFSNFDKQ